MESLFYASFVLLLLVIIYLFVLIDDLNRQIQYIRYDQDTPCNVENFVSYSNNSHSSALGTGGVLFRDNVTKSLLRADNVTINNKNHELIVNHLNITGTTNATGTLNVRGNLNVNDSRMRISDSGVKIGASGTNFQTLQYGTTGCTGSIASQTFTTINLTGFSRNPSVFLTPSMTGVSYSIGDLKPSGFNIVIDRTTDDKTTSFNMNWFAIGD